MPHAALPPVTVCWDLDGTLLWAGPIGGEVLRAAFVEVTGLAVPGREVPMGGMTDHLVAGAYRDALDPEQAAPLHARGPAYPADLVAAVAREWVRRAPEVAATARLLPGARVAVDTLAATSGVRQVVVTGNVRAGAEAKLAAVGLHPGPLDLDAGAYGDLPGPRAALVHAAREHAVRAHAHPAPPLVVVGDTPRDVEAAHAAGAVAVGVATGSASADELRAAGADHLFADLTDVGRLVAVVRAAGEDAVTTRGSV